MNLVNFMNRLNDFDENPPAQKIFKRCAMELINDEGRKEVIKPQLVPKSSFPKTFEYFDNLEKILLN